MLLQEVISGGNGIFMSAVLPLKQSSVPLKKSQTALQSDITVDWHLIK